jgi:hypothetical protein
VTAAGWILMGLCWSVVTVVCILLIRLTLQNDTADDD